VNFTFYEENAILLWAVDRTRVDYLLYAVMCEKEDIVSSTHRHGNMRIIVPIKIKRNRTSIELFHKNM